MVATAEKTAAIHSNDTMQHQLVSAAPIEDHISRYKLALYRNEGDSIAPVTKHGHHAIAHNEKLGGTMIAQMGGKLLGKLGHGKILHLHIGTAFLIFICDSTWAEAHVLSFWFPDRGSLRCRLP